MQRDGVWFNRWQASQNGTPLHSGSFRSAPSSERISSYRRILQVRLRAYRAPPTPFRKGQTGGCPPLEAWRHARSA